MVTVARLSDHTLAFFGKNRVWDGGMETVVAAPGREVWGVLYELTFGDAASLDIWCGARLDGGGVYFHYPVRLLDASGGRHAAVLYKKDVQGPPVPPSREYLAYILSGAAARGLPAAYLAQLKNLSAAPARYPVPRAGGIARGVLQEATCATCAG
jgi:hypothetical protein